MVKADLGRVGGGELRKIASVKRGTLDMTQGGFRLQVFNSTNVTPARHGSCVAPPDQNDDP